MSENATGQIRLKKMEDQASAEGPIVNEGSAEGKHAGWRKYFLEFLMVFHYHGVFRRQFQGSVRRKGSGAGLYEIAFDRPGERPKEF